MNSGPKKSQIDGHTVSGFRESATPPAPRPVLGHAPRGGANCSLCTPAPPRQFSSCGPPASKSTTCSTRRTRRPRAWSRCWSGASTPCRPSASPATSASRWGTGAPRCWVSALGAPGRAGLLCAEGQPVPDTWEAGHLCRCGCVDLTHPSEAGMTTGAAPPCQGTDGARARLPAPLPSEAELRTRGTWCWASGCPPQIRGLRLGDPERVWAGSKCEGCPPPPPAPPRERPRPTHPGVCPGVSSRPGS